MLLKNVKESSLAEIFGWSFEGESANPLRNETVGAFEVMAEQYASFREPQLGQQYGLFDLNQIIVHPANQSTIINLASLFINQLLKSLILVYFSTIIDHLESKSLKEKLLSTQDISQYVDPKPLSRRPIFLMTCRGELGLPYKTNAGMSGREGVKRGPFCLSGNRVQKHAEYNIQIGIARKNAVT